MPTWLRFFLGGICVAAPVTVIPVHGVNGQQLVALFEPERLAYPRLAPDGRHLAYVLRGKNSDIVVIVAVDQPARKLQVALHERSPARIDSLVWTSADLLAVSLTTSALYAVDLATGRSRRLLDAESFATPAQPGGPVIRRPPRLVAVLPDEADTVLIEGDAGLSDRQARAGGAAAALMRSKAARQESGSGDDGDSGGDPGASAFAFGDEGEDPNTQNGGPLLSGEGVIKIARLNLRTGLWKRIEQPEIETSGGTLLYDQQGYPRLLQARGRVPERLLHLPVNGTARWPAGFLAKASGSRWEDLDTVITGSSPLNFQITAENFLGHRSIPLGFDHDPQVLYYASNIGRDTFGIYAFNLQTRQRTALVLEDSAYDLVAIDPARPFARTELIFDRQRHQLAGVRFDGLESVTRWVDPELAQIQGRLADKFPGRNVQIREWDRERQRFLVVVASPQDRGRCFIFLRSADRCVEFLRLGPGIAADDVHVATPFEFATASGITLTGTVTESRAPRSSPAPLVVYLHDGPWQRVAPGYNRDVQAFADMGFNVLQLNYRGSSGLGVRFRNALRSGPDTLPVQDVLAAMQWAADRHPFDSKRVALLGEGFGGYLALRAAEMHPAQFSCVVSINAPADLAQIRQTLSVGGAQARRQSGVGQNEVADYLLNQTQGGTGDQGRWAIAPSSDLAREVAKAFFPGNAAQMKSSSVLAQIDALTLPVLFAHDPGHPTLPVEPIRLLQKALEKRGNGAEFLAVPPGFASGNGAARLRVYRRIREFLNDQFYKFNVEVGESTRNE